MLDACRVLAPLSVPHPRQVGPLTPGPHGEITVT